MGTFATVLAAGVVLLLPGWAALRCAVGASEEASDRRGDDALARGLAMLYSGVGVACIALWVAAWLLGLSRLTALGAPVAAAMALLAGSRWSATRSPAAGRGAASPGTGPGAGHLGRLAMVATLALAVVAVTFLPYGWRAADGVHRMGMTDWEKHLVMASGVAASTEFPPAHPYIHTVDEPSYHFGYQLLGAAIHVAGGRAVDLYPILLALSLLTAAATPFVVYTVARDLCGRREALLAAVGATLLIGFDLLVVVVEAIRGVVQAWPLPPGFEGLRAIIPSTHVDFWIHNVDRQFSAPLVATMWAPHNVAAALLALLAIHLVRESGDARRRGGWLLQGMLIASLPALSAYVALMLAVGVGAAVLAEALGERRPPHHTRVLQRWLAPGLAGLTLALPTFPTLAAGSSSGLVLSLSASGTWSNGAIFNSLFGHHWWTDLLDTPAVYLIDFGIVGVLGAWGLVRLARDGGLDPARRQAAAIIVGVVLLATFVRPPLGIGNNLYARGLLLAWFLLAPFAAIAAARWAPRRWLLAGVLVCAAGSAYAVVGYVLEGAMFWGTPVELVETMHWVNEHRPPESVVALDPADEPESRVGYWLRRPTALSNPRLARLFGASEEQVSATRAQLQAAFGAVDPPTAARHFDAVGADTILVRPGAAGSGADVTGIPRPAWARPPCFDVLHEAPPWLVVARRPESCVGE